MERVSFSNELIMSEVLCEYIHGLFICRNIIELNFFELQCLMDVMVIMFDVFETTILDRV